MDDCGVVKLPGVLDCDMVVRDWALELPRVDEETGAVLPPVIEDIPVEDPEGV